MGKPYSCPWAVMLQLSTTVLTTSKMSCKWPCFSSQSKLYMHLAVAVERGCVWMGPPPVISYSTLPIRTGVDPFQVVVCWRDELVAVHNRRGGGKKQNLKSRFFLLVVCSKQESSWGIRMGLVDKLSRCLQGTPYSPPRFSFYRSHQPEQPGDWWWPGRLFRCSVITPRSCQREK